MVTQTYKQGNHEIKIEIAESIDDAKKNNFENGVYAKYYIDNKRVANYYAMIRFMSEEAKKTHQPIIQDENKLVQIRNEMLHNQNKERKKQLEDLKNKYVSMGISSEIIKEIDVAINKINSEGIRIS